MLAADYINVDLSFTAPSKTLGNQGILGKHHLVLVEQ